jgi:hypothetical protein
MSFNLMKDEDHCRTTPPIPLEALTYELRCRCEAACRFSGGYTYHWEAVSIFRRFAEENGLFLETLPQITLQPAPESENEHEVWFTEDRSKVLKATWPGFFGKLAQKEHEYYFGVHL